MCAKETIAIDCMHSCMTIYVCLSLGNCAQHTIGIGQVG